MRSAVTRILLVEDDTFLRDELRAMLVRAGYAVDFISDFGETSRQILEIPVDLILLDLNLPGENGFQICRAVKARRPVPILVLSSRDQLQDELRALKLGADEYLTKPFRRERLLARIANVLKRYEGRENLLEMGRCLLDRNTYTLYAGGRSTVLTQNQGKLLEAFWTARSDVVRKEELSRLLWNTTTYIDENALQVNVSRLKKVMRELALPYRIQAIRGEGYRCVPWNTDGAAEKEELREI